MAQSTRGGSRALALAAMLASVVGSRSMAHRLDEYLQAARLAIDANRVELHLELTPGVAVAEAIIPDLDRDRDGRLSPEERSAYVSRVLGDIVLKADGQRLLVQPVASSFPHLEELRSGEGTITLRSSAALPRPSEGAHRLLFRNSHRPEVSVYLANVLAPDSGRVAITAQRRDANQRELTIDFAVRSGR